MRALDEGGRGLARAGFKPVVEEEREEEDALALTVSGAELLEGGDGLFGLVNDAKDI